MGDKWWLIEDLVDLKNLKLKSVDIADISAVPENIWKPKFNEADILFFEGGNTFHLMEWVNKSGLTKLLPEYLKTKVFVGISAGSMIASKNLALEISKILYKCEKKRCPKCRKIYQSKPKVLNNGLYGNNLVAQCCVMHYFHGIPIGRIESIFGDYLTSSSIFSIFHKIN